MVWPAGSRMVVGRSTASVLTRMKHVDLMLEVRAAGVMMGACGTGVAWIYHIDGMT
jgi:hypothetical protein